MAATLVRTAVNVLWYGCVGYRFGDADGYGRVALLWRLTYARLSAVRSRRH